MSDPSPKINRIAKKLFSLRRRALRKENRNWPDLLQELPRDLWPKLVDPQNVPIKCLRSRGFFVAVYDERDFMLRLSCFRADLQKDGHWKQDLTWEELQDLKRQAGYGDRCGVEVFPADADVVHVANMRHLFLLPSGQHIGWRPSLSQPKPEEKG